MVDGTRDGDEGFDELERGDGVGGHVGKTVKDCVVVRSDGLDDEFVRFVSAVGTVIEGEGRLQPGLQRSLSDVSAI